MVKVVNIYPKHPILTITPPIRTQIKKVSKSTGEIYKCMLAGAIVEEVMKDGKVLRLTFSNYNKDNTHTKPKSELKPVNKSTNNINNITEIDGEPVTPIGNLMFTTLESDEEIQEFIDNHNKNHESRSERRRRRKNLQAVNQDSTIAAEPIEDTKE